MGTILTGIAFVTAMGTFMALGDIPRLANKIDRFMEGRN